ncbi:MAG: NAD(P)-binding domain-containing protein, partial [Actinomycetes bacterium]
MIDIPPRLRVAIIGAGFGGIAAAIELKASRIDDVQILDSAPGLGGTWLHNSYPGSACDVPSHLYSYSFAQRRDWKRLCPLQPEILEYIENVASDYAINELIRTDTKVSSCLWDEQSGEWAVSSSDGATIRADAIVIATGQLHQPAFPKIEG